MERTFSRVNVRPIVSAYVQSCHPRRESCSQNVYSGYSLNCRIDPLYSYSIVVQCNGAEATCSIIVIEDSTTTSYIIDLLHI
jgi:hypothetical protein